MSDGHCLNRSVVPSDSAISPQNSNYLSECGGERRDGRFAEGFCATLGQIMDVIEVTFENYSESGQRSSPVLRRLRESLISERKDVFAESWRTPRKTCVGSSEQIAHQLSDKMKLRGALAKRRFHVAAQEQMKHVIG